MDDSQLAPPGTKKFGTDNHVSVTKGDHSKRWGICGAMSIRWIAEGLKAGSPIILEAKMPSQNNIAITQGAWTINASKDHASMGKWLVETFNLKAGEVEVDKITSWREIAAKAQNMPGFVLFTVKGGSEKAGHAMAFFIGGRGAKSYYLDPNLGVYEFANAGACVLAVANHMKTWYDGYKKGESKLYPLTEE
jgi:hypothetical protein